MEHIDTALFWQLFNEKRGQRGLAAVVKEIGISRSTLQCLMDGNVADGLGFPRPGVYSAFFAICNIMCDIGDNGRSVDIYVGQGKTLNIASLEQWKGLVELVNKMSEVKCDQAMPVTKETRSA